MIGRTSYLSWVGLVIIEPVWYDDQTVKSFVFFRLIFHDFPTKNILMDTIIMIVLQKSLFCES